MVGLRRGLVRCVKCCMAEIVGSKVWGATNAWKGVVPYGAVAVPKLGFGLSRRHGRLGCWLYSHYLCQAGK